MSDDRGSDAEYEIPLVPARMLSEFAYCPRVGVLMWVHNLWADSSDTVDGSHIHRRVDVPGPELPTPESTLAVPGGDPALLDEPDFSGGAPPPKAEAPFVTRSVWMSAESEQLTCKMDLVGAKDGEAVPVDTKRSTAPDIPEGAWEPERVQLCAQGLVLRANGWRCTHGFIYFAGSKRRVRIEFDEALVARTRALVVAFREASRRAELPPPLVNSSKCVRCSLAGICLPDETRLLAEGTTGSEAAEGAGAARPARQLLAPDAETSPLYVSVQGGRIGVSHAEFVISDRDKELARARIAETSHIAVVGSVQVTAQAMSAALREEIPVCFFSYGGWFNGIARGMTHKHVQLRIAQFRAAEDPGKCLDVARAIVRSKIRNQRTLLRRNANGVEEVTLREMQRLADVAPGVASAEVLLGVEGAAARLYFASLPKMLKVADSLGFDFTVRNRRPPRDPVNALLSFAYGLLTKDAVVACEAVGFDPYLGFYHRPRYGRPALALDMIEELRPLIADSAVLMAINNGEVGPGSFVSRADGCTLTTAGRRAFIATYERRMEQVIQHPLFGYKITWRRCVEVQARLLGRHLLGEIPRYVPMETR